MAEIISYRKTAPNVYRVTYDGRILGDSRGYDRAGAEAEAKRIVDAEHDAARRECREARCIYRPGY